MKNGYFEMAQIFKALSDENRIKIVEMLLNGEMCAADILEELNITQPTLSHHMKTLCESGIVECRKSGKWMYYKISKTDCKNVLEWLKVLMDAKEGTVKADLSKVAAKRTEKLLKPRTAHKKKAVKKKTETKAVEVEKKEEVIQETPRRRDVDIVIL